MKQTTRVALIIPFLGFLFGYFLTYWFMQQNAVSTPNVIGKSLQESVAVLSRNCLSVRLIREQEDSVLPEGIVLDQIPKPYQKVRPNQNVFVTVSKKESFVMVPDFWGQDYQQVINSAANRGLELKTFFITSNFPKNKCVAQYPSVGQVLEHKRMIAYFSSGDVSLSVMPLLKGLSIKEVEEFFNQREIEVEVYHQPAVDDDHRCDTCKVVEQRPSAGSVIDTSRKLVIQVQAGI